MKIKIFIVITVLMISLPLLVIGQSSRTSTPILKADDQIMEGKRIIARGNVEIAWEEYRIYADYMEYNQETDVVLAQGRVTMTSNETVLSGERLEFNIKDRKGVMFDAYGQMAPSTRYDSKKLTQVDDETLRFDKINFTTCNQCLPRWRITCTKGKIKKEKYIEMKNAVVKIKNIPLFYIPYMRFPLDPDGRATGFLFPAIGRSDLRGFYLLNSFFWAIKPNIDLTLSMDYYGKAGIGAAQELRYAFPKMEGNIQFYYFKYKNDAIIEMGDTVPSDTFWSYNKSDYYLKGTHKQKIDFLNTRITVDIDKQSDANFLRLFSNDFDSVLRRTSRSSVSIDSSIGNVKLNINAAQNDTYYTFNNNSNSLRYFPRITLNWNQQKVWKLPGYFSLKTVYTGVQRIGESYDADDQLYITDIKSSRLFINPSYTLNLLKTPWLNTTVKLSTSQSFYSKSYDLEPRDIIDESLHLYYHTANLDFTGPSFSRIFNFGKFKLKHFIEPSITMRYVTKMDEEDYDRLIKIDSFDYPSYSYIGFSLKNRLLYKGENDSSATEILSLILSQDYYFDAELANRNRKVNGVTPQFSEFKTTLRIRPVKAFSFDASLVYNHYLDAESFIDNFSRIRLSVSYTNKKSFINGNFYYSRYINPYVASTYIFNRDTIGGRLNFDKNNIPIKLDARINYDITAKEFRNANIKFTYDYQCIQFHTELTLFKYSGRVETQFNFGISLGNFGMVKDFLGIDDKK